MDINSKKLYEVTKQMQANKNVKQIIKLNIKPGLAVDIGCGAGRDTIELIKNKWKVIAIDKEDVSKYIKEGLTELELKNFKFIKSNFEDVILEKNNLVIANNSLAFCSKRNFERVWDNIVNSIEKDGYFVGTFFGIKDSWLQTKNKMKFYSVEEINLLFKQFNIIELNEIEKDGISAIGECKHWHIYAVIAQKK